MIEHHGRHVQAPRAGLARSVEELCLFLAEQRLAIASEVRTETPDPLDQRTTDGHVHAERRLALVLEDERPGAVILDRDRAAEIAGLVEPCRPGRTPDRPDRSAGVVDVRPLEQRPDRGLDPVSSHVDVIVGEHDDPGLRRGHARVERVRLSLASLEQVLQRHREPARARDHDVAGVVARVVVDHEDVPREPGISRHRREAVERAGEVLGAVVGADQDGRVDLRRRSGGDRGHAGVRASQ